MTFALRYAVRSDVGLLREGNEDSAYAGPHLLAVADGMGGYEAGEVASAAVIKSVAPLDSKPMPESELIDAIAAAVTTAKQNLRDIVEADPAVGSMGTTLTAMLWSGATAAICHIGDSRAYLLRAGDLYQITRDHTFVQALVDQGRIRPDEAATHPQRSLLLRALDGRTDADPDLSLLTGEIGDRYLLCSDGLPVAVSDEQILEALAEIGEPSDVVLQLIELAIRGGGPDNITCIVADVIETGRTALAPTKAPVIAGAAASVGAQTMQFARPGIDGDASFTRLGTGPAVPGSRSWPADPAAQADQRGNSGQPASTRPGTVATATADPEPDEEDDYRGRGRRRWPVMTVLLALFVVIIGGGLVVGYQVVRSQYYVSSDAGKVAIFRGINDKLLGVSLSSVYQTTSIPVAGITVGAAAELRRADTSSLAMAQQFVANIRKQYNACQSAYAALRAWVNGKPKPVLREERLNGKPVLKNGKPVYHKVQPPYHKPKPTIPSACPPQPAKGT